MQGAPLHSRGAKMVRLSLDLAFLKLRSRRGEDRDEPVDRELTLPVSGRRLMAISSFSTTATTAPTIETQQNSLHPAGRSFREPSQAPSGEARGALVNCLDALALHSPDNSGSKVTTEHRLLSQQQTDWKRK